MKCRKLSKTRSKLLKSKYYESLILVIGSSKYLTQAVSNPLIIDAKLCFFLCYYSEENRCRVREKELREKDILIQDNLIRFSSFLLQQDTRKKRDIEAANSEQDKIREKDREIDEANSRKFSLAKHNERVNKKMTNLRNYENYLKLVQSKNQDEFSELQDVLTRHTTLETTNNDLK